jgi:two-component system NarL family sensor kinase
MELHRVYKLYQLRVSRIASVLRIGVVALMVMAMLVGTRRSEWPQQTVLLALYSLDAVSALIFAFSPARQSLIDRLQPVAFTIIDVLALTGFQLLSTHGLMPLMVMTALPILAGLDVSSRRAVIVLVCSWLGFVIAGLQDPVMIREMGWPVTIFGLALYGFLCCTALVVVRVEERHANTVAGLSALREELLADTMTAAERVQRRISESIHDGPLQDVLAARQELVELDAATPGDPHVNHALACLQSASERLREATFELHPAVLEQVGVGAAVEQLASFTARRSGVEITTDIDYPVQSKIDPIVFGVIRELLSNVVRHAHASHASVVLGVTNGKCHLDVADDGVGVSSQALARRLSEGHIGLASHRARVEAAGGSFTFLDEPVGAHVRVELPL